MPEHNLPLADGQKIFADNVIFKYIDGQYQIVNSSLKYANLYVISNITGIEHEVKHRIVGDKVISYYNIEEGT